MGSKFCGFAEPRFEISINMSSV